MKKVSVIAAAVVAALSVGSAFADDKVEQGWQVNGYGHLLYNAGESLRLSDTWKHRDAYRAAGAAFSGNPTQVEFSVARGDNYDNGSWSKYVLKAEYGNHEDHPEFGNGRGWYNSSSGNEEFDQSGAFAIKEAYVQLGDLSFFAEGTNIWAGQRYLNRQAGIISKEFWKQSSGVGAGIEYNNKGIAIISADANIGYDGKAGETTNGERWGQSTTMTTVDLYWNGFEALGGRFDFDIKFMDRVNLEDRVDGGGNPVVDDKADSGVGAAITFHSSYYGFDGWSTTGLTYGKDLAAIKGVNFGKWSDMNEGDTSLFFTSYGVANITDQLQFGSELVYWNIDNDDLGQVWGADGGVTRIMAAVTPSYKVNDNFRMEAVLTYSYEDHGQPGTWGRTEGDTTFYTATLAPVFTVNADYWGRPQIKPYVTYMSSSDDSYEWSGDAKGNETRVGVEAEIWF